jgi:hypothetical protein
VDGELPPAGTCTLPSDWSDSVGADFRGRIRYLRSFGCPSGLDPGVRVDLVIGQLDAWGSVYLNHVLLGQIAEGNTGARFNVTRRLVRRNEVRIEVELPSEAGAARVLPRPGREHLPGGVLGEVRLEIFAIGDA